MLHTSAVTFCHSAVEQLIDHHSKAAVVNGIEQLLGDKIDAKASQRFVRTPRDVSVLRNPHVLQLAVKGVDLAGGLDDRIERKDLGGKDGR